MRKNLIIIHNGCGQFCMCVFLSYSTFLLLTCFKRLDISCPLYHQYYQHRAYQHSNVDTEG